jgi:hypothetical protein
MDTTTGALWVAASFATSLISNKAEARIHEANTKMQVEQARLQAAEQAYERTKAFRKNLSTNLALSGMGYGGNKGFAGTASQSIADYLADSAALGRQDLFAQLSGQAAFAGIKANKFKKDVGATKTAAQLASELGLFTKGLK